MDESNLELFKQAISEGLSEKFDSVVDSCTEKIVCSEKHNIAMRTIVYGKANTKRTWSPRMKLIIAILIAAALLLTSCGIIFRDEIREVIEEFFASITFSESESDTNTIEEVYELTYLPEGYTLEKENIYDLCVTYKFVDKNNNVIIFEQRVFERTSFTIDSEKGYSHIKEIDAVNIYSRYTGENYLYIWNDGQYSLSLKSNKELSNDEIVLILDGLTIK